MSTSGEVQDDPLDHGESVKPLFKLLLGLLSSMFRDPQAKPLFILCEVFVLGDIYIQCGVAIMSAKISTL